MNPDEAERPADAERRTHAVIAAALARLAGAGAMTTPHPYLTRYLAQHAALGGVLDDGHVPPALLPWSTGDGVRGLLRLPHPRHADRRWLTAWSAVEPYVQEADLPSRCSSLHFAYTALWHAGIGHADLPPEAAAFPGSRVRVLWSQWTPASNVLATLRHKSGSLAVISGADGGQRLAIGGESGAIELIDALTGSAVGDRVPAHDGAVRNLLFVPDSAGADALVSGSTDGTVRVWDTAEGTLVSHERLPGNTWTADLTGYRKDGGLVVVAVDGEGAVTEWRQGSGQRRLGDMSAHPREPAAFTLALTTGVDGRQLLVGAGATLKVWDIEGHRLLHEHAVDTPIRTLAGTAVPGRVISGHSDGSIRVWDAEAGAGVTFPGQGDPVTSMAMLRVDGVDLLAAVTSGSSIDLWDIGSEQWAGRLDGHADTVTALCTMPDGDSSRLVSIAWDSTVRFWDAHMVGRTLAGSLSAPGAVTAAFIEEPGTAARLAVSYATSQVQVWDIGSATSVEPVSIYPEPPVRALAWAPGAAGGNEVLLWAAADHSVRMWDPANGHLTDKTLTGHAQPVRALAACPTGDGRRVAVSGSDDCTARMWDLDTGRQLRQWRHFHSVRAVAAATGDGRDWFASGSTDGTVRIRQGRDEAPVRVLPCRQGVINALALNASQSSLPPYVASGGDDGTVGLWNLVTHEPVCDPLRGHSDAVDALATWSVHRDDGAPRPYVASAGRDGTIRFWDACASRCVLQLATGSRVRTLSVQVSGRDHRQIVVAVGGEAGVAVLALSVNDLEGLADG
ncbi:WD40 repeat domain-containing protein [Streptomyces sp. ISL-10]|uniref:WD40 repeat domain-containing protein n=1 Tax=Streptomyces sp. ISL-10 TaxID=2819172 RepID=UPI001BE5BAD7|nr:WD40 repeat domain-containing protein [Streptomyces sp. ISL-10]MBT2370230.1 WD40 repeat domain-containing protein [Streptomyces sp. ISL-10]